MVKHYLKIAFRQLLKNKTQYILSIVGIAVGMLCFSITTYYVRRYNSQFTAWEHADRIAKVQVRSVNGGGGDMRISGKELNLLLNNPVAGMERISSCEHYTTSTITFIKDSVGEVPFHCSINKIAPDYISIYDVRSVRGHTPSLKIAEVLISESCARKVYKNENPVGKTLYFSRADNDTSAVQYYTICAVIKDLPEGTEERADLYFFNADPVDFENTYWSVSVLLPEGVSSKEVNKRLRQQYPLFGENADNYLSVQTLTEKQMEPENILVTLLVPLIGALILIIAMINFLKLCIYSFYSRSRELSLRKSLGSGIGGLFLLLFCEVSILLAFAMVSIFAVTEIFVPFYYLLLPESLGTHPMVQIDTTVLLRQQLEYVFLLFLLCGTVCFWVVYRIGHMDIIKGVRSENNRKQSIRNFVLGLQLFICFLFIGGSAGIHMINREIADVRNNTLTDEECGQIWKLDLWEPQLQGHTSELIAGIHELVGVEDILLQRRGRSVEYKTLQNEILYGNNREVSENYISFMKQPMQGRMPRNESEIAVSRRLVWQMEKDGLDKQSVLLGDKNYQITGVYEVLPFEVVLAKEQAEQSSGYFNFSVITVAEKTAESELYVKCIPGQEQKVKNEILRLVRTYLPASIPFKVISMREEVFSNNGGGGVLMGKLFAVLSFISILITMLGIYSAITLDTRSRQKEVALRKINGATAQDIYMLFGKLYIRLLVIAGIPALTTVYAVLYITVSEMPISIGWLNTPLLWLGILLLVSLLVFLTVAYRIRLISMINPAEIIKTE